MGVIEKLEIMGHEQVAYFRDPSSGLKGIVAIHNTILSWALHWVVAECGIMHLKRMH